MHLSQIKRGEIDNNVILKWSMRRCTYLLVDLSMCLIIFPHKKVEASQSHVSQTKQLVFACQFHVNYVNTNTLFFFFCKMIISSKWNAYVNPTRKDNWKRSPFSLVLFLSGKETSYTFRIQVSVIFFFFYSINITVLILSELLLVPHPTTPIKHNILYIIFLLL